MTLVLSAPFQAVLVLVAGAVVILLAARPLSAHAGTVAALGAVFAVIAGLAGLAGPGVSLVVPALAGVALVAVLLLPAVALQEPSQVPEIGALILLGTGGSIAVASAADLLQLVVAVETLALSAVTLVALGRGERPLEAAFKLFVLGAIGAAVTLYGVGLVYLGTGSLAFPTSAALTSSTITQAGAILVALGLAFELALVPFHWGALDAYTAAPPGLAGFVMSASKLGAVFALGRLVQASGVPVAEVLVWVGCLTIVWGTFGAIAQRGLRRMLAYSTITHAGFMALALGSGPQGPNTAAFYAAIYASMAMLVFGSLAGRAVDGDAAFADPDSARPLGPLRSAALALGLFSLSGIPPTPGFWAKLAVLVVAWQFAGPLPTLIAIAGGVFSVLYYLRPLPDLFAAMRGAPTERPAPVRGALPAVALAALAVIALGLFPTLAWSLATLSPGG